MMERLHRHTISIGHERQPSLATLALCHTKLRLSRMYPKKMHAGQRNDFTSASCQHLYKFAWIELACRVRQQVCCSASTVTNASGDHFKKFTHNRAMLFPSEKILNPDPNVPSNTYILTQTQGHCQHASCHFAAKNKRVKELDAGYPESNENR